MMYLYAVAMCNIGACYLKLSFSIMLLKSVLNIIN